jgi:hypothetical protein
MPGGGRGYTRSPSLVSVWATAPFLLNNKLGDFHPNPDVDSRMKSFDSAIEQLLWPEKRSGTIKYKTASGKTLRGEVDVTTENSYIRVPKGYLPPILQLDFGLSEELKALFDALGFRRFIDENGIVIGPIPKGTPVGLLGNIDLGRRDDPIADVFHKLQLAKLLLKLKADLAALPKEASDDDARAVFANALDDLLALSKCPDFIVNRGHYFGTDFSKEEPGLSDADKQALIAFLKTM